MSWDDYKKKREEEQSSSSWDRYKQQRENPNIQTNKIEKTGTNIKKNEVSIWDRINFTMSKFSGGAMSGTTGIAQSGILDMANNARKGKDKNALSSTTDFTKSLFGIMNPMQMTNNYISKLPSYIKETVNNITDKDKTIKEKIINQGLNANNYVINNIPSKDLFNTGTQLAGKINPNLDETLLKANEEIRKPSENYNKYLAEESKKYDNTTNFIASGFESVGNMIPSIVGTALTKNPSVGLATMGLNVKGQATQEALDKGKDLDTAVKIGDAKALVEIATEKISGGAKIFGKGNLDDLAEELVKKGAKSKVGQFLLKQLTNTGGEILEEEISNVANNLIDKGTTDPNKKVIDLKEGLETMGSTAFTTTLLNLLTGGMVSDYKGIKSNQYEDNKTIDNTINQNNTHNFQQESIQEQQILPTQQINQEQNYIAQNGNMEQILPTQQNNQENNITQKTELPVQNSQFYNNKNSYEVQDIGKTTSVFKNDDSYTWEQVYDIEDNVNNDFDLYSIDDKSGKRTGYINLYVNDNNQLEVQKISDKTDDVIDSITVEPNKDNKFTGESINKAIEELTLNKDIAPIPGQIDITGNQYNENVEQKNNQTVQNENIEYQKRQKTVTNQDNIKQYTQNDINRFTTGKNNLIDGYNSNIYDFVNEHYDEKTKMAKKHPPRTKEKKMFLGRINDKLSESLNNLINNSNRFEKKYNLKDYNIVLSENNIEHSFNRHGNEKEVGQIDVTPEILAKYGDVISDPDYIGLSDEKPTKREPNPKLFFAKKINGYSVAIEVISDKKQLFPKAYYAYDSNSQNWNNFVNNKKLKEVGAMDSDKLNNFPEMNVQDDTAVTSSINNSIPQNNNKVNDNTITNNSMQNNKNNTQNIKFENDNIIKDGTQISNEETAKILTEPLNKNNEKRKLTAFLKANLIDKGMVFEELSRKTGNRELQSKYDYTLTAEARGQNAIGNARYDYQTSTDKNGKIRKGDSEAKQISKSLTDIIDEVGENTEDFYNYMYHQLNVDRMTLEERYGGDSGINYERKDVIKNKPVFGEGVTADISRKYVEQMEQKHPEFKEYAQDVYDFLDANKQELVKNGVISQETSDLFKEMYPHYVPIARVDNRGSAINVPLDTKRTGINSPIKRAKGGSRDIQPLFQTMADRTLQTYRASAKNSFGIELKNTLRNTNQLNQISELSDVENVIESLSDENKNNELLQKGENGNNPTFTVFENGEKVTYEISNDMYDALKPKNELFKRIDESKLSKGLTKFNNFRRGLLTEYNPVFSITNAIKDAQDVLLNSQHSAKTYSKIPESTAQILNEGYWYKEYIQNGGEQNSYFKDGEFEVEKKNIPSKIKDTVTLPLRAISAVNNVIEMTPRLAEYIASREQGKSIESAMLDASRVTTNFKAGGDFTKTLNRNGFTFLNASVQGMQQQIRNIQEANAKGLKGYAVLASKYAIAGLPVLLLNNLIWSDDDDYEDLQDYVKDNYYIIGKTKNGTFIRIPKGRAVATIQKIVSNVNDFIKDDKINADDVGKEFWNDLKEDVSFAVDNLAPNNPLDNNIIAPFVQVAKNKTWYGDDLVPKRLQSKPKEEQYDETTDWLSKWIGEHFKVSPMKVNYLMDQYSGGVGDVILPTMTPQAENNVLEDKFTTNPTMKNKYPGKFFEKIDELTIANNSEKATDLDKVKYKYASDLQSEISDLYKEKRNIQNSSDDDKTKKEKLQEVQEKINSLTQKGLEKIDEIKINKNTSSIDGQNYYKYDGKWKKLTDEENEKLGKLPLEIYADYKNKINEETNKKRSTGDIEEDGQLKSKDKINILRNSNYSDKDKKEIYSNFINSKDNTYQNLSKLTNVNIDEYLDYKMQNITGDEDTKSNVKGKTVKGSKEEKVRNYLKNSKMSDIEKIYICAKNYKLIKDEKETLKEYMNKLSDKDKLSICKDLTANFELHKDGNYYWK